MYRCEHLVVYILIFLVNSKTINSSFFDGIDLSLNSPRAVTQLDLKREEFSERKRQVQQVVDPNELIRLNVGGQIIATRRATLTKVPSSLLAKSFDGSYQTVVLRDFDGTYFFDYNPILFTHLLDQLRILKNNDTPVFRPPLSSSSTKPFYQMLRDFRLPLPQQADNDVIALNVGGEKIVILRKTLTNVSNSYLALLVSNSKEVKRDRLGRPFLDYDPTLFHYLLDQLREGKQINDSNLKAPNNESADAFKAMVNALGVSKKTIVNRDKTKQTTMKKKKKSNNKKRSNTSSTKSQNVPSTTSIPSKTTGIKRKKSKIHL